MLFKLNFNIIYILFKSFYLLAINLLFEYNLYDLKIKIFFFFLIFFLLFYILFIYFYFENST